jgi:hypothetical protein
MERDPIHEWLRLETLAGPVLDEVGTRQADELAEVALTRLFGLLPLLSPPARFAAGVIARSSRAARRSMPARILGSWGARAATVWVAAEVAILVAITTAVVGGLAAALGPVRLLGAVVGGSAVALDRALEAARVGMRVAELSQSSLVAAGPTLLVSLVLCIAASAVGVALLAPLSGASGGTRGAHR